MEKLYLSILLWHFLYDFHLQGAFIAEYKAKSYFILFIHSFTWALGLCLIALFLSPEFQWVKLSFLTITHMIIDDWKCHIHDVGADWYVNMSESKALYIDQFLHLITIILASL